MSQSRSCAGESSGGASSGRGRNGTARPSRSSPGPDAAVPTASANPAIVGRPNSSLRGTSTSSSAAIRAVTLTASSECPPRPKKSSSAPSRSAATPSTSAKIPATCRSRWLSGGRPCPADGLPGAGSALRSILPFGVRGSAGSGTTTAGTMIAGSDRATCSRSPANSASPMPAAAPPASASASVSIRSGSASGPGLGRRTVPGVGVGVGRGDGRGPDHVRHQGVVDDRGDRAGDPGVGLQGGLDLAQLDTVASQLHLAVGPAKKLQPPVRQPSHPVAGPVQA